VVEKNAARVAELRTCLLGLAEVYESCNSKDARKYYGKVAKSSPIPHW
jgi:hypothetical protein